MRPGVKRYDKFLIMLDDCYNEHFQIFTAVANQQPEKAQAAMAAACQKLQKNSALRANRPRLSEKQKIRASRSAFFFPCKQHIIICLERR